MNAPNRHKFFVFIRKLLLWPPPRNRQKRIMRTASLRILRRNVPVDRLFFRRYVSCHRVFLFHGFKRSGQRALKSLRVVIGFAVRVVTAHPAMCFIPARRGITLYR